ncbi:hypothetical protein C8R43DRAFT_904971, partial [Mycena crocata]
FAAWFDGKGKTLWLPAMPGAGKTVLASLVIQYLRNIQREQPAFMDASKDGESAVVKLLLQGGANDEVGDKNGKTALILAKEGQRRMR